VTWPTSDSTWLKSGLIVASTDTLVNPNRRLAPASRLDLLAVEPVLDALARRGGGDERLHLGDDAALQVLQALDGARLREEARRAPGVVQVSSYPVRWVFLRMLRPQRCVLVAG